MDYQQMASWFALGVAVGYAFGWLLYWVNSLFRLPSILMGGD